jgi:hypothetical protein
MYRRDENLINPQTAYKNSKRWDYTTNGSVLNKVGGFIYKLATIIQRESQIVT